MEYYVYTKKGEERAASLNLDKRTAGDLAFCGGKPLGLCGYDTARGWERRGYVEKVERPEILKISRASFNLLRKKYPDSISKAILPHEWAGKVCKAGDWTALEGALTGDWSGGSCLIFEHIHFEIV